MTARPAPCGGRPHGRSTLPERPDGCRLVDAQGLVLRVRVHPADLHDRVGAPLLLAGADREFPRVRVVWADQGDTGSAAVWMTQQLGWDVRLAPRRGTRNRPRTSSSPRTSAATWTTSGTRRTCGRRSPETSAARCGPSRPCCAAATTGRQRRAARRGGRRPLPAAPARAAPRVWGALLPAVRDLLRAPDHNLRPNAVVALGRVGPRTNVRSCADVPPFDVERDPLACRCSSPAGADLSGRTASASRRSAPRQRPRRRCGT